MGFLNNYERVLVVAAHPDDEVLGAGGTIARLTEEGTDVYVLLLSDGEGSRGTKGLQERKNQRRASAQKAAEVLGIKGLFFRDFPDNSFDSVPRLQLVKSVEEVLERIRPQIVLTHSRAEINIDHTRTFEVVTVATRPFASKVWGVLSFEVPSSTNTYADLRPVFTPSLFVDITQTMEKKMQALKAYAQEIKRLPHPRSIEGIKSLAVWRGVQVGFEMAEAFEVVFWKL